MKLHIIPDDGEFAVWATLLSDIDPEDVTAQSESFIVAIGATPASAISAARAEFEAAIEALLPAAREARSLGSVSTVSDGETKE